ncbi:MAG: LptF/LptG family permease [Planctomycetota bacterium]|nr:LptF/LptG family permease [Planctomycetota bacterium]
MPEVFALTFPLVLFLAFSVHISLQVRNRHHQLAYSVGVGAWRLLAPALLACAAGVAAYFLVVSFAIPYVAHSKARLERKLFDRSDALEEVIVEDKTKGRELVFHLERLGGSAVRGGLFATGFHCYHFSSQVAREVHARSALWHEQTKTWELEDGTEVRYSSPKITREDTHEVYSPLPKEHYLLNLSASSFRLGELWRLRTSDRLLFELCSRVFTSFALLFGLLFLGPLILSVASRGIYLAVSAALLVSLVFYGLDFMAGVSYQTVSPIVAAALPLAAAFAASIFSFVRTPL